VKYARSVDSVVNAGVQVDEEEDIEEDRINEDDDFDVVDGDDGVDSLAQQYILNDIKYELNKLDFNTHRIQCAAHTLNLVVKDGLEKTECVRVVIAKVANFVNKVHKSHNDTTTLEEFKCTLQSHNVTRWNSQLVMIKSFLNLPVNVVNLLHPTYDAKRITGEDRLILADLVSLLMPFYDLTIDLQSDSSSICILYGDILG
jgi:hypothetical protein